jgi:hypothetical protein
MQALGRQLQELAAKINDIDKRLTTKIDKVDDKLATVTSRPG